MPLVFTEKDGEGGMSSSGFGRSGTNILVVEDIVTTGGSVKKTIEHSLQRIARVSVLVDRSGGKPTSIASISRSLTLLSAATTPKNAPAARTRSPSATRTIW